jgi:hypothetical protein
MRFKKLGASEQRLLRTFSFLSSSSKAITLDVTLEYIPPTTLNEMQEQQQRRIVGTRSYSNVEELSEIQKATQQIWHSILASRITKISGMTVRKMAALTSVHADQAAKVGLDEPIPMDPADATDIPDGIRKEWEIADDMKTMGQLAKENILYLINASDDFCHFVANVVKDVSFFQDADWEKQVKNSGPGAATNSAVA